MKKLIAILCAFVFLCLPLSLCVCADTAPRLTISSKTAVCGDTVNIPITISNNPGIMAMTFSVKYDSSALSFMGYAKGYLSDYTVFDDKQNNKINIVNCEDADVSTNGNIIVLQFLVKETAPKGFFALNIEPINNSSTLEGCFAKGDSTSVVPTIINGGVTVGTPCVDTPHKFSDFSFDVEPTCTKQGLKSRSCTVCGHTENQTAQANGHDFESEWTVDREAGSNSDGILSRHCKNCDATTDIVTFKYDDQKSGITNKKQTKISPDVLHRLEKFAEILNGKTEEQHHTTDPLFLEGDMSPTQIESAQQLVDSHGKVNMSLLLEKIYNYLFGNEESNGIFDVIYEYFSSLNFNPLWLLLLLLVI